jgi:hypothetical protein
MLVDLSSPGEFPIPPVQASSLLPKYYGSWHWKGFPVYAGMVDFCVPLALEMVNLDKT